MPYKTYKVEGSVKNYFGNQMDYLDKKTDLKKSHKILAAEGIFPHEGGNKVKIELLDSRYKIIQTNNKEEKTTEDKNKKVKVIDYGKLKEGEKKIKNKLGIEKRKIVYFD